MKTIRSFFLCFIALPVSCLLLVFGIAGTPFAWTIKKLEDNGCNARLF